MAAQLTKVDRIKTSNGYHTLAELKAALIATGGMQSLAAKRLGISRQAVSKRVLASDDLKQIVADQREEMLDEAEDGLRVSVRNLEPWAICFTLKTIGKYRGYIERTETDVTSGGRPLSFTLNLRADDADGDNSPED
jgi:hypothetical protein